MTQILIIYLVGAFLMDLIISDRVINICRAVYIAARRGDPVNAFGKYTEQCAAGA